MRKFSLLFRELGWEGGRPEGGLVRGIGGCGVGLEVGRKGEAYIIYIPSELNPSCRQATIASGVPQASSHTVPHTSLLQTSTRPVMLVSPPWSLMSPWTHTKNRQLLVCK